MLNLSSNLCLFLNINKSVFKSSFDSNCNFKFYLRPLKLSDCVIIAFNVTAESIGIDSENYLFGKLKNDFKAEFPDLINRYNYNRRRKVLAPSVKSLNQIFSDELNQFENSLIVDSIPVPICKIVREKSKF